MLCNTGLGCRQRSTTDSSSYGVRCQAPSRCACNYSPECNACFSQLQKGWVLAWGVYWPMPAAPSFHQLLPMNQGSTILWAKTTPPARLSTILCHVACLQTAASKPARTTVGNSPFVTWAEHLPQAKEMLPALHRADQMHRAQVEQLVRLVSLSIRHEAERSDPIDSCFLISQFSSFKPAAKWARVVSLSSVSTAGLAMSERVFSAWVKQHTEENGAWHWISPPVLQKTLSRQEGKKRWSLSGILAAEGSEGNAVVFCHSHILWNDSALSLQVVDHDEHLGALCYMLGKLPLSWTQEGWSITEHCDAINNP